MGAGDGRIFVVGGQRALYCWRLARGGVVGDFIPRDRIPDPSRPHWLSANGDEPTPNVGVALDGDPAWWAKRDPLARGVTEEGA